MIKFTHVIFNVTFFKMLCLKIYIDTLIIGPELCSMFSTLNKKVSIEMVTFNNKMILIRKQ